MASSAANEKWKWLRIEYVGCWNSLVLKDMRVLTWIIGTVGKITSGKIKLQRSSVQVSSIWLHLQQTSLRCANVGGTTYAQTDNTGKYTHRLFFFLTFLCENTVIDTHVGAQRRNKHTEWDGGGRMEVWKWVGREASNVRGVSTTHTATVCPITSGGVCIVSSIHWLIRFLETT